MKYVIAALLLSVATPNTTRCGVNAMAATTHPAATTAPATPVTKATSGDDRVVLEFNLAIPDASPNGAKLKAFERFLARFATHLATAVGGSDRLTVGGIGPVRDDVRTTDRFYALFRVDRPADRTFQFTVAFTRDDAGNWHIESGRDDLPSEKGEPLCDSAVQQKASEAAQAK